MTLTEEQRGTAALDLEKARARICHYRIENPGDADTDCGLEDLIRQANLAEEALDEIERLQADAERLQLIIDSCHEDLNCKSNTIDELDSYLDQCRIVINQKEARIKELEAEIRELEDALIEQEARFQYYVQNEN